jgi:membrane protein
MKKYFIIIYKLADEFGERIAKEHLFLLASGIAFNIILCIIPLLLVASAVVGSFTNSDALAETLNRVLSDSLPPNQMSVDFITSTLKELQTAFKFSNLAGWIGGIGLLWTSSALFSTLRTGLNAIFSIKTPKFFLLYKLQDIILTLVLMVLLLASSLVGPAAAFVGSIGQNILPENIFGWISGVTLNLVGIASSVLFFYFVYQFIPNKKLPRRIVITATLLCSGLWEAARFGFAWYLANVGLFGKIYGAYAIVFTIAIWIYYSSLITLISAEAAEFWYEKLTKKRKQDAKDILNKEQTQLILPVEMGKLP